MPAEFLPVEACPGTIAIKNAFLASDAVAPAVPLAELWQQGRYRELSVHLNSELAHAETIGDRVALIAAANDLACVQRALGDHESAAYFQLLAATAERQPVDGEPGRISAKSLGNLACDAMLAGKLAIAESLLWKSLLAELASGNEPGAAADWANLGLIAGLLGDLESSKQRLWTALKLHRLQRDQFHLALDLWHLGQLFEIEGDWNRSTRLFQRAAELFRRIGHQQFRRAAESQRNLNAARAAVLSFDASRN